MSKVHLTVQDPEGLVREDVYIYALLDVDGVVRYVGSTSRRPTGRLREHIVAAKNGHMEPVYAWIRSLLDRDQMPQMLILERVERLHETYHPREAHWIRVFGGAEALLNRTETGTGGGPWMKGKLRPQYVKDAVSKAQKGRIRTPEQLAQQRANPAYLHHKPGCLCLAHYRKVGT